MTLKVWNLQWHTAIIFPVVFYVSLFHVTCGHKELLFQFWLYTVSTYFFSSGVFKNWNMINTSMPLKFEILPTWVSHVTKRIIVSQETWQAIWEQKKNGSRAPDGLGSIDDLFDPGHTQGDVHGGYTCKVERLQGHLGAWFTNALGTECAYCRTWLHLCPRRKRYGWKVWQNCWGALLLVFLFDRKNAVAIRVRKELALSWGALVTEEEPGTDQ